MIAKAGRLPTMLYQPRLDDEFTAAMARKHDNAIFTTFRLSNSGYHARAFKRSSWPISLAALVQNSAQAAINRLRFSKKSPRR